MTQYPLFVACAKGLEGLLAQELTDLGMVVQKTTPQGVYGEGDLALGYRICLWSRLAHRVQWILFEGEADDAAAVHALCLAYPWPSLFSADKTLAVAFHGTNEAIRHTVFGGQVIKDAIVDAFRKAGLSRPSVSRDNPDILVHAYLRNTTLTVSLDFSGESLHKRGYRLATGDAPIRETLAAALLMRANWPAQAAAGAAFHDPFCGSGTIVIEAAMMAACRAPGLHRTHPSFTHWLSYEPTAWANLLAEAKNAITQPANVISGSDQDPRVIQLAIENADRAGVAVTFTACSLRDSRPQTQVGLMVCNPPYGERLGTAEALLPMYRELGETLSEHYRGWQAAFLTSEVTLAKAVGLRASLRHAFFNGPTACTLYQIFMTPDNNLRTLEDVPSADAVVNRLKKNEQHLRAWVLRENIHAYRVYDRDLPDYAFVVDRYNDYAVVQEYAPPRTIDIQKAAQRRLAFLAAIPKALNVQADHVIFKARESQKGSSQYQKIGESNRIISVQEGDAFFKVNLYDYLDTGLFIDHRHLRKTFAALPRQTRFLNCYCYTGTASVHAALAGAKTTNVDLSHTYLDWAKDNFRLNRLSIGQHAFIPADVFSWLKACRDKFDVIFLDPPSFSNSKRMTGTLDVQRDHEALVECAMRCLAPGGLLYFSTNKRQFKLSERLNTRYTVKDISAATHDKDVARYRLAHHCYELTL